MQVPWKWLQNLGLCEGQAETQVCSQCSFYTPDGVGGNNGVLQECLPASSPTTYSSNKYLRSTSYGPDPILGAADTRQTGTLSSGH